MNIMNSKESFLSNLVGNENYNIWKPDAKRVFIAYSVLLVLLFLLKDVWHWKFASEMFSLFTGSSLFFMLYVAFAILFFDVRVDLVYGLRNWKYKLTSVWGVTLVVLGISAVIYTNHIRRDYALECMYCFIEEDTRCFHIHKSCGSIKGTEKLKGSKVFKAKELGFRFCVECEEWIEDAEFEYESLRYYRR